jgi:DNA polymerase-3 subunit alpha
VTAPFVHLHLHSEYSLADGLVRIPELVAAAARLEMPAVALTDLANMFGAVKFYRAAHAAGIKPILGAEVWIESGAEPPGTRPAAHRLVLLCLNRTGYGNLCRLLTRAYAEGQHTGRPCLAPAWLEEHAAGLIALSGGLDGEIAPALLAGQRAAAEELARAQATRFPGGFYLELSRTGRPHEEEYIHAAVALAQRLQLPVIATNNVRFLDPADFEAHEVRVCIHEGRTLADPRRPRRYTAQQYLRSPAEMAELFRDIPEALENSVEIARRCNVRLEFGRYFLPDFPVPAGLTLEEFLRREAEQGLAARLPGDGAPERRTAYHERLALELGVIIQMGFAGYFLIVADFIRWAKTHGIPVGPGRGSGAGSLVAWCLGITELDPIRYELLFERFLNPERISMPDFDVDFCGDRRDEVIAYVAERYGHDRVSQIITHGSMAAKAVVRDVGRVLDHPYGYVDKLAKLIPRTLGITLDGALAAEPRFKERYDQEEDVRAIIDTARKLEGLVRNAGRHAGGVVIAPSALTDFMPLYLEQGSHQPVGQFDMKDLEKLGLVKFDFLGVRMLTIIDRAVKIIAATGAPPPDIAALPLDDPRTFALIKSGRTTALFQLESRGMKDLILKLQPGTFEDLIALVALYRPGPLGSGMVDDFIARKHGRAQSRYLHPRLETILKPTYGVILYQEQAMQIAQVLAGYSLGRADLLRRAMGKKLPEEMAKERDGFVQGCRERGVSGALATQIFELIEKFAEYGFNRSHSAAYALIAYQTAWLKAHHPAAFMAAVLTAEMSRTDEVVKMIAECRDLGLELPPPDINRCEREFVPLDDGTILYGLGAIKGLGDAAIEALLEARARGGPFTDLFDLCRRADTRRVNRRVYESLIRAGALDGLGTHRAALSASLGEALAGASQHSKNRDAGQHDLFGAAGAPARRYAEVPEWDEEQRLQGEKDTLGLYLTGHPIARYEAELAQLTEARIADLRPSEDRTVTVAGLVVGLRGMQTRRGDRMAFVTLDDRSGRLEIAVFSELYQRVAERLVKDALLVVKGQVSVDEFSGGFRMSAEEVYDLEGARAAFATRLEIELDDATAGNGFVRALAQVLKPAAGGPCPVYLQYRNGAARAELRLGQEWRIQPTRALLERLEGLAGAGHVRLVYPPRTAAPGAPAAG